MPLSMYQASVPVLTHMLGSLAAILRKAEASATERGIEPSVLLTARLAPDMLPLARQIQIASDSAKGGVGRLAGLEVPSFPDTETTFDELQARIAKTVEFINTATPAQIDGSEEKPIVLKLRDGEMNFTGQPFLLNFCLPNFMFHVTTAYAILRHNGVPLGKRDFLGGG